MTQDLKISLTERAQVLETLTSAVTTFRQAVIDAHAQHVLWEWISMMEERLDEMPAAIAILQSLQPAAQVAAPEAGIVHPVPVSGEGVQFQPDALERIIDEYVADYEMYGENAEGLSGTYTPNETERGLIKDAIIGLLADPDWDEEWGAHIRSLAAQQASSAAADETSPNEMNPTPPVLPIEAGQQESGNEFLSQFGTSDERLADAPQWVKDGLRVAAAVPHRMPAQEAAEPSDNGAAKAVWLIYYDDAEVRPNILIGEAVARKRFADISGSWNAHLFVKVESNCRDDRYYKANIALQAPAQKDAP